MTSEAMLPATTRAQRRAVALSMIDIRSECFAAFTSAVVRLRDEELRRPRDRRVGGADDVAVGDDLVVPLRPRGDTQRLRV